MSATVRVVGFWEDSREILSGVSANTPLPKKHPSIISIKTEADRKIFFLLLFFIT
ncbi:hypothetical protein LBYZC6_32830 [Lacrimispora brassicae]